MRPPVEPDSTARLLDVLVSTLTSHERDGGSPVPVPSAPVPPGGARERRPARQGRRAAGGAKTRDGLGAPLLGISVDSATAALRIPPGGKPKPPPGRKPAWGASAGAPTRVVRNKDEDVGDGKGILCTGEDAGRSRRRSRESRQPRASTTSQAAGGGKEGTEAELRWVGVENSFSDTMQLLKAELKKQGSGAVGGDDKREDSAEHFGGRTPSHPPPTPLFISISGRGGNQEVESPVPGLPGGSDVGSDEVSVMEGWNERLRIPPAIISKEPASVSEVAETPYAAAPVFYKNFSESKSAIEREQMEGGSGDRGLGVSSREHSERGKAPMETPRAAAPVFYKNFAESMNRSAGEAALGVVARAASGKRPASGVQLPEGSPRSSVDMAETREVPMETPRAVAPVFYKNFSESRKAVEGVEGAVRSNDASSSSATSPLAKRGALSPISDDSAKNLEDSALGMKPAPKVGVVMDPVKETETAVPALPVFFPEGRRSRRWSNGDVGDNGASSSHGGSSTGETKPTAAIRASSLQVGSHERPESMGKRSLQDKDEVLEEPKRSDSSVAQAGRWSGGSVREQIEVRKQQRASLDDVRTAGPLSLAPRSDGKEDGAGPKLEIGASPGSASVTAVDAPLFFTSATDWHKTRSQDSGLGSARSVGSSAPAMVRVKSKSRRSSEVKEYVSVNSKGQTVYAARNGLNLQWVKPSMEEAERVRGEKQAHHARFSIWASSPSAMHAFGAGVGLFFWTSKWLVALMLLLSLLSLPTMIVFGSADYAATTQWPITTNLGSLGDFGPVWHTSIAASFTAPTTDSASDLSAQAQAELYLRDTWWLAGEPGLRVPVTQSIVVGSMDKSSILLFASSVDFFASVVIAATALWLHLRARRMERRLDDENWTISDYTVMVTGLPDYVTTAEVAEYFGAWGGVRRVEVVHDDGWFYSGLEERGAVVEMAEREVAAAIRQAGDGYIEEMFLQLCTHVKESSEEFLETVKGRQDHLRTVAAFVTFESAEKMAELVDAYAPYCAPLFSLLMPSTLTFRDARIKVVRAPEPTNVQFDHLSVSPGQRALRSAATWLWLLLTLLCSFVLMSIIVSLRVEAAEGAGTPRAWVQHLLLWAGVALVLGTNMLLWAVALRSARREAHPTFSQQRVSATLKLALALLLSTALLAPAANALFPFVSGTSLGAFFLGGVFPDFTPRWYHEVGLTLFLAVLLHTIFVVCRPVALVLITSFRRKRAHDAIIQCDMNRLMEGPRWDLRERLALHLNILSVVIIFGSALPLLYVAGLIYFTAAYLADKAALLHVCRLPPLYGAAGMQLLPSAMAAALLARLAVAAWAFSFLHAGPSPLSPIPTTPTSPTNLLARLLDTSALAHTLALAVALTLLLTTLVVRALWSASRALFGLSPFHQLLRGDAGRGHGRGGLPTSATHSTTMLDQPALGEVLSRGELVGPDTYCIRNSVWYAPWHVEALLTASLQLYMGQPGLGGFMKRVEERHNAAVAARKMALEVSSSERVAGTRYLMQPGCESVKLPPNATKGGGLGLGVFMSAAGTESKGTRY